MKYRDKILARFQQKLPSEFTEDHNPHRVNGKWQHTKGNYDKYLTKSDYRIKGLIEYIRCPICSKNCDFELKHGDAYRCGKCKSVMRTYGNGLYVWSKGYSLREERREKLKEIEKKSGIFSRIWRLK